MATVDGLRPLQTDNVVQDYDRGQRPLSPEARKAEALRPQAAPVSRFEAQADPANTRLGQLAEALSQINPTLKRWTEETSRGKEQEQAAKIPAYIEQIKKDNGSGLITATQVGEMFPETVPTIRWRIAQAMGEDAGRTAFEPVMAEINAREDLKYDTQAREAFLEEKKKELFASYGGKGNDFYDAGFIASFEKAKGTWDVNWQRETASKHLEVMGRQWQREAVDTLLGGGPQALEKLDAQWKQTGALHHQTRNDLLIKAVTETAYHSDDPALLDAIPERFLNRESKAAVAEAKVKIEEFRKAQWRFGHQLQQQQREDSIRKGKADILADHFNGRPVNPADYWRTPELAEYAMSMKDRPRVDGSTSAATFAQVRQGIIRAAMFGDPGAEGFSRGSFTEKGLTDAVLTNRGLNGDDAQRLIKEIPDLMKMGLSLNDPEIKTAMETRLAPTLANLESSTVGKINKTIGGRSLRSHVTTEFMDGLRRRYIAHYEETGALPTGYVRYEIIEKALVEADKRAIELFNTANIEETNRMANAPQGAASKPTVQNTEPTRRR